MTTHVISYIFVFSDMWYIYICVFWYVIYIYMCVLTFGIIYMCVFWHVISYICVCSDMWYHIYVRVLTCDIIYMYVFWHVISYICMCFDMWYHIYVCVQTCDIIYICMCFDMWYHIYVCVLTCDIIYMCVFWHVISYICVCSDMWYLFRFKTQSQVVIMHALSSPTYIYSRTINKIVGYCWCMHNLLQYNSIHFKIAKYTYTKVSTGKWYYIKLYTFNLMNNVFLETIYIEQCNLCLRTINIVFFLS